MADTFCFPTVVDGTHVTLYMWDTSVHDIYDRLRPLCYPGTDVIVLCYSVVLRETCLPLLLLSSSARLSPFTVLCVFL